MQKKTVNNSIKGIKSVKRRFGAGITLADNVIKNIINVIKFQEIEELNY